MDDLKTLEKEHGVNISWAKKENGEMQDGLLGGNEAGQKIAQKLMDQHGGW